MSNAETAGVVDDKNKLPSSQALEFSAPRAHPLSVRGRARQEWDRRSDLCARQPPGIPNIGLLIYLSYDIAANRRTRKFPDIRLGVQVYPAEFG